MRKKFLSFALMGLCSLTALSPFSTKVYAANIENTIIESSEFDINPESNKECIVNASVSNAYTITLPKKITLSGNDGSGSYDITIKGNIAARQKISIVPDNEFNLKSAGKEDVKAVVTQPKKIFNYEELSTVNTSSELIGTTTSGTVTSGKLSKGTWSGTFKFNIDSFESSQISVDSKDENLNDLHAEAYTIEGIEKDILLESLVDSELVPEITNTEDITAIIEVKSDDFENIADTTFDVSTIAEEGDKVVILHFDEEKQEWEYMGTGVVEDGKVSADFTSYSPVAFVVINSEGEFHIHNYIISENRESTCVENGVKISTCSCGDTITETFDLLSHNHILTETQDSTCTTKGLKVFKCTCGDTYTEDIEAKGHNHILVSDTSSCTMSGTKTEKCECGDIIVTDIIADGHKMKNNKCLDCDYVELEPGFYDENNDLVIGWDTSNISISTNVSTDPNNASYYKNIDCIPKLVEEHPEITKIIIPAGATAIGNYAFYGCSSLTRVDIPEGITRIRQNAFNSCSSLTEINLPTTVTRIDKNAFDECTGLRKLCIPETVITIGDLAFNNVSIIEYDGTVEKGIPWGAKCWNGYYPTELTNYMAISSGLSQENDITIPKTTIVNDTKYLITGLADDVFKGCTNITSVTIQSNILNISNRAFYNCRSLAKVVIPDSVTSIGAEAFYNCTELKDIFIPLSVTTIGNNVIAGCTGMETVYYRGREVEWQSLDKGTSNIDLDSVNKVFCYVAPSPESYFVFSNGSITGLTEEGKAATEIGIPEKINGTTVKSIGSNAFKGQSTVQYIYIPNTVTTIGSYAFAECSKAITIPVPKTVTSLDSYAFMKCSKLKELNVPYGIKTLENDMCQNCVSLEVVKLPSTLVTIENNCFNNCIGIKSIVIPKSVTTISSYAFNNCAGIETVYYTGTQAQWNAISMSGSSINSLVDAPKVYNYVE